MAVDQKPMTSSKKRWLEPVDRVAIAFILGLTLLIGVLLGTGSTAVSRVRSFNWEDKTVGAADKAFVLEFNRPMDRDSVVENLSISPSLPLPGKISWAGQRMVYTLPVPAPYGQAYDVRLQDARDSFADGQPGQTIEPFEGQFRTRDRAFAYVGVEGEESGRLVLSNLTHQQKRILTPTDLVVMDFEPYPDGDKLLFSAINRQAQNQNRTPDQQIYTVTTGIQPQSPDQPKQTVQPAAQLDRILDSESYRNLKFDLSPDGKLIVVQRVKKDKPGEFGLWIIKEDEPPRPLDNKPGGDFIIAPDSASLAVTQGQGVAILPFEPQADPLQFLPKFGTILTFAADGSAAAMVKFNTDYTRSLFLVTNQGTQKELMRTTGSILNAEFDVRNQTLYCLLTELVPGETYQEQPFLEAIDLDTTERTRLLKLSEQRDVRMSLAPDNLALLIDQVVAETPADGDSANESDKSGLRTSAGESIATSQLWILPLDYPLDEDEDPQLLQPEPLPFPGVYPRWLP